MTSFGNWVDQCESIFITLINSRLLSETEGKEGEEVAGRLAFVIDRLKQMRLLAAKAELDARVVGKLHDLHEVLAKVLKPAFKDSTWDDPLGNIDADPTLLQERTFLEKKCPTKELAFSKERDWRDYIWRQIYEARVIIEVKNLDGWDAERRLVLRGVMYEIEQLF